MPDPDPSWAISTEGTGSTYAKKDLVFPYDLEEQGKMIVLSFWEYKKNFDFEFEKNKPLGSISLPVPPHLSQTNSTEWAEFDGGLLARLLKPGVDLVTQLPNLGTLTDIGGAGLDIIRGSIESRFGKKAETMLNIISSQSGVSMNPRKSMVFKEVDLRKYEFSYRLIARKEEDSLVIRDIVRKLQFHSHPNSPESIYSGNYFLYPDVVDFKFIPDNTDSYLFKPNMCAITKVTVSYNGQSSPIFFKRTGAPVEVILTLSLTELTVDTKQTLMKKWGETPSDTALTEDDRRRIEDDILRSMRPE